MKRWAPIAVNILLFDALWTLAVVGAATPWWWAAPVLIIISAASQLCWSPAPGAEASLIIVGAAAGVLLDCGAKSLGLFDYRSAAQVEFIAVFASLWINFGTTLRPSLRWMWRRPLVAAAFGAVGGPLAYWTAARLGAISPTEPAWHVLGWTAVQFGVATPLWCMGAARLLSGDRE